MPSHFCLICHLNHLNLHLMYLIKCIKTISQLSQISFFLVFLMHVYPTTLQHWNSMLLQVSITVLSLNMYSIYLSPSAKNPSKHGTCWDWNLLALFVGIWWLLWWQSMILGWNCHKGWWMWVYLRSNIGNHVRRIASTKNLAGTNIVLPNNDTWTNIKLTSSTQQQALK